MTRVLDPEGAHLAALRRLGDFRSRRVLELGCGDGRLTPGIARDAASVLAFDPDAATTMCASTTTERIDFADKKRQLPNSAVPGLMALVRPSTVRERCRLRRLQVR